MVADNVEGALSFIGQNHEHLLVLGVLHDASHPGGSLDDMLLTE